MSDHRTLGWSLPAARGACGRTCEGHDEHADGDGPRHAAVALAEVSNEVGQEDAEALDESVSEGFHEEEGPGYHPAPAPIWLLGVHFGPQAARHPASPCFHGWLRCSTGHTERIGTDYGHSAANLLL